MQSSIDQHRCSSDESPARLAALPKAHVINRWFLGSPRCDNTLDEGWTCGLCECIVKFSVPYFFSSSLLLLGLRFFSFM